jgi:hypothetical protein
MSLWLCRKALPWSWILTWGLRSWFTEGACGSSPFPADEGNAGGGEDAGRHPGDQAHPLGYSAQTEVAHSHLATGARRAYRCIPGGGRLQRRARPNKGVHRGRREERKVVLQSIWAEGGLRHGTAELHGGSHGGRIVRTLLKHSEMEGWGQRASEGVGSFLEQLRHSSSQRSDGVVHGDHVVIWSNNWQATGWARWVPIWAIPGPSLDMGQKAKLQLTKRSTISI